jgi:acyl carrier protein
MDTRISSELTSIFHEVFDDDSIGISESTKASDVDGWDSLNHIRLIMTVENRFKIKFSAKEIGSLKNVGELVSLIQSKVQ